MVRVVAVHLPPYRPDERESNLKRGNHHFSTKVHFFAPPYGRHAEYVKRVLPVRRSERTAGPEL